MPKQTTEYQIHSREVFLIENPSAIFYLKRMEEKSMEDNTYSSVERIGGVTFTVNVKPAEKTKQTADEFIKALITKECLALKAECV